MKRKPEFIIEDALEPVLVDGLWYDPRTGSFTVDMRDSREDVSQKQATL